MMHVVEVITTRETLAAPMAKMRTWLDHHQIQPALFEFSLMPNRQVRFRLQFREASEAATFAQAFGQTAHHQPGQNLAA